MICCVELCADMLNFLSQTRWDHANANIVQPNMTRPFLNLYVRI